MGKIILVLLMASVHLKAANLKEVIVAVVDTGIDVNHLAFQDRLWKNSGEIGVDKFGKNKSKNGIDDDKNGFIDDVNGWNFANNNNNLTDQHGHGTHIAGIVGAKNRGVLSSSGVAANARIMVLKYFNPKLKSKDNITNTIKAINYAVKMGAKVINYSSGGDKGSLREANAIKQAEKKQVIFICAAGNESRNSDEKPFYPANYKLSNIISVGSINSDARFSAFSNYGSDSVLITARGNKVFSTVPGGGYAEMSGTSQAAAYVSGVAALILGRFEYVKDTYQLKKLILSTAKKNFRLSYKVSGGKIVDEQRALKIVDKGVDAFGRGVTERSVSTSRPYILD